MELQLQHKPAAHCENGTISNLLRFYGVEVSEPMAFGLASGRYADDLLPHIPWCTL